MASCSTDGSPVELFLTFIGLSAIISVAGTLCNCLSLWCLLRCPRTGAGMKIQLGCFFGLMLAQSSVSVPFGLYSFYHSLCGSLPASLRASAYVTGIVLLEMERCHFASMAVYRLLAVRWPLAYQRASRVKMVVASEVAMAAFVISSWLIPLLLKIFEVKNLLILSGDTEGDPRTRSALKLITGFCYSVPMAIGIISYVLMMITLWKRKRETAEATQSSARRRDSLSLVIQVILLTFILLDVPHIVIHAVYPSYINAASVVVHTIFWLHLIVDPLVFVCLNRSHASHLISGLKSRFRGSDAADEEEARGEATAERMTLPTVTRSQKRRDGN